MLAGKGATETRPAAQDSDTRSLHPFPAVLLGATQRGTTSKAKTVRDERSILSPSPACGSGLGRGRRAAPAVVCGFGPLCEAPRSAERQGLSGPDCLSGAAASFRHGLPLEHRRVSVRSTDAKARVPFLLPTFSLGKQRKVGRPIGRNQRPNRERESTFATRRDRQGGV